MAVDNRLVAQLLTEILSRHFRQHPGEGIVELVGHALDEMTARRNDSRYPTASLDQNLAAAEHYLVARWSVGTSAYSLTQMTAMVLGYEHLKMVVALMPRRQPWGFGRQVEFLLRSNPRRPTAPPSHALIAWGVAGARAGAADRIAIRGAAPDVVAPLPAFAPILSS